MTDQKKSRRGWCGGAVLLAVAATGAAEVPRQIHFQGRLRNSSGVPIDDAVDIRFRIYDHPTNPMPLLFDETHGGVAASHGLFSVLVGSQTPGGVPDSALAEAEVYLGISINAGPELMPRTRLATVPNAIKARSAERLVRPNTFAPAVSVEADGRVGVGTAAPDASAAMDVSSSTGGMLIPRMSQTERDAIANPAPGLFVFNSSTGCFNLWNGAAWRASCFDCDFTLTAAESVTLCTLDMLQLTASTIPAATYSWVGPNGFTSTLQNPTIPNITPEGAGVYIVRATRDGCTSDPAFTIVTVNGGNSTPSVVVGSNSPVCPGGTLRLTASSVALASYQWSGPNGFSSTDQNPVVPGITEADAGDYHVHVAVCNNESYAFDGDMSVSVGDPSSAFAHTPESAEPGTPFVFTPASAGLLYAWTFQDGTPPTSSDQMPSVTWSTAGDYDVTLTVTDADAGCSSTTTLPITICNHCQTYSATGSGRTGSMQTFTVPTGVSSVTIEAWGAQGGDSDSVQGGLGARMKGRFSVTPGETLRILVGQQGLRPTQGNDTEEGGGGGGTFVTDANNNPLVIAGGGGGSSRGSVGSGGTVTTSGSPGLDGGGAGGTGGEVGERRMAPRVAV